MTPATPRRRGRPSRTQTEAAPATRDIILAAAREEFSERGYEKTSVRGIAKAAGVDSALVHHYFGTKEQVFFRGAEGIGLPVQTTKDTTRAAFRPQENAILQPGGNAGKTTDPAALLCAPGLLCLAAAGAATPFACAPVDRAEGDPCATSIPALCAGRLDCVGSAARGSCCVRRHPRACARRHSATCAPTTPSAP